MATTLQKKRKIIILAAVLFFSIVGSALGHGQAEENGSEGSSASGCAMKPGEVTVMAPYVPGRLTMDGVDSDWETITGADFMLEAAYEPSPEKLFPQGDGKMTIKAAHDGHNLFVLLRVPGQYKLNTTNPRMSPAVALMFKIGDEATLQKMGGCPNIYGTCNPSNCHEHEVDLVQFRLSNAIPGRLYGANAIDNAQHSGQDRFGSLTDGYCWNPHCRWYDGPFEGTAEANASNPEWGAGGSQNDWQGAWGHSSFMPDAFIVADMPFGDLGADGVYIFELQRPLRTSDRLRQDAQLTIGKKSMFGAAAWWPSDGSSGWKGSEHWISSCDWLALDLLESPTPGRGWSGIADDNNSLSNGLASAVASLALLIALSAIFVSIVVGWWVRNNSHQFTRVDHL